MIRMIIIPTSNSIQTQDPGSNGSKGGKLSKTDKGPSLCQNYDITCPSSDHSKAFCIISSQSNHGHGKSGGDRV